MKNPFFQRSSFWALTIGVAIVAASAIGFRNTPGVKAFADATSGSIAPETAHDMLRAMDNTMANLAKNVEPAVVHIDVGTSGGEGGMSGMRGEGSGVIYRPDGYIITNDHVVNGMDTVEVHLADGRKFKGTVFRSDEAGDIAVVKIDANNLPTIPLSDSNKVRPGITAMAIGSPFGLDNSVTIGHVSALDRLQQISDARFPGGQRFYADLIQTDAAINMGNSGGALVDIDGNLIGINTAIASSTGGSNGIGFAVPANQAKFIADMLIKDGKITRAFMGLEPTVLLDSQKKELGTETGAYVARVEPKTPAAEAGIQKGDVITKIQDMPVVTYMDLRNAMFLNKPGTTVRVEYLRDHQTHSADITLQTPPKPQVAPQNGMRQGNPFQGNPFQFRQMPDGQNPFSGGGDDPFGGATPFEGNPSQMTPHRSGQAHFGAMIMPVNADLRAQFHIPADKNGMVVVSTEQGSVAERVGLLSGDLITDFNGKPVDLDGKKFVDSLHSLKQGAQASISFSRWSEGGTITTVTKTFTF